MHNFDGAYEPSHIGPRAEIEGDRIIILWRGAPALETTFTVEMQGERAVLSLAENGLCNPADSEPYAYITEIFFEDGSLTVTKDYRFSGADTDVMQKTTNSRYGNVTIVTDELLPLIQGSWSDDEGFVKLTVEGDTLICGKERTQIVGVRYNYETGGRLYIRDIEPSRESIAHCRDVYFESGELHAVIDVCDAPSMEFTLKRK